MTWAVAEDQGPLEDSVLSRPLAQAPLKGGSPTHGRRSCGGFLLSVGQHWSFSWHVDGPSSFPPDPILHCQWLAEFFTRITHLFWLWIQMKTTSSPIIFRAQNYYKMTHLFASFELVYNLHIFGIVCKKSHFLDKLWKLSVRVCLVLGAGQLGLKIKIWDHFWTRFDTKNPMAVSN